MNPFVRGVSAPAPPTVPVFDFGRVLFDWQPEALLQRVLPQRAPDAAQAGHWTREVFQGYEGDWGAFDRGEVSVPALVERIAARTGLAPAEVKAVVDAVPDALQPLPGTVALLAQLKDAGHPLYFLSNMPAPYADHLERTHACVGWFDRGVFSGRVGLHKPDPRIYEHAQACFGHPAHALLFIDDHRPNVDAARALGWHAVQFTDAETLARDLRDCGLLR